MRVRCVILTPSLEERARERFYALTDHRPMTERIPTYDRVKNIEKIIQILAYVKKKQ